MRRASLLLLPLTLAACSSSGIDAIADAGASDSGVQPAIDAGAVVDSAVPTADGDVPNAPDASDASVARGPYLLSTGVFDRSAGPVTNLLFFNYDAPAGARCAITHADPCWVIACTGTDAGADPTGSSAGALSLAKVGGDAGGDLLSMNPASDGTYSGAAGTGALWVANDSLAIKAAGATVAAFEVDFPAAPGAVVVTDPAPSSTPSIPRSADLTVTWNKTSGKVAVGASQSAGDLRTSNRFFCVFDGSTGTGTVPKASVGALQPSSGSSDTAFNIGGVVEQDVVAGGASIHAVAWNAKTFIATTVP